MARALYGPGGFFVSGDRPAAHFRTSVHASDVFAAAVVRLLSDVDSALGRPERLDVVDVGAGRAELLRAMAALAPAELRARLRLCAVELAPPPADLPPEIAWRSTPPEAVVGVLLATEWLDNLPLDVVEVDESGRPRYVLVDPASGAESLGDPVSGSDREWLDRWWPLAGAAPGFRAEIGAPRDEAWRAAVSTVERGIALCVDYGHRRESRPALGTLTAFRGGRRVPLVPDGSCDLTAHVAMDSLSGDGSSLVTQRDALRALGVRGERPALTLASTDPAGYVRALAAASLAGELTDRAGLGGHLWLLQPIGITLPGDGDGLG